MLAGRILNNQPVEALSIKDGVVGRNSVGALLLTLLDQLLEEVACAGHELGRLVALDLG